MKLDEEASRITELLSKKAVRAVYRHRQSEVVIEFSDGSCLIVDAYGDKLECSITGPKET